MTSMLERLFAILLIFCLLLLLIVDVLPVIALILGIIGLVYLLKLAFRKIIEYRIERYFRGKEFSLLKEAVINNIAKSNELNNHIEELKCRLINKYSPTDYGESQYSDNSVYAYKRPHLSYVGNNTNNEYFCSLSVCKNAQNQPFKYICKYFNIDVNEETLNDMESLCNDFSAAKEGINILLKERKDLETSYGDQIPSIIRKYGMERFYKELGFLPINSSDEHYPKYSFKYISPAGNSSLICDIVLNLDNLERFSLYILDQIRLMNSIKYQRLLMTRQLRNEIMNRDNYTCQKCGLSISEEPNLLLEIDHIIPISKGGKTICENLQTLCWRCNRQKSNKLL